MTLKCPNCAKPIQFQDVVFNRFTSESLTTLGSVRITRRGSVQGNINCGELLVQGVMNGSVHVRGRAIISSKAKVVGSVRAHAISVEAGGSLRGSIEIIPPPKHMTDQAAEST
jgi:cytoskeletal protein CcmA (bactofilin family)